MSLVNAAKYLESKGRNGDSMLVHMSPGEVKSLQGLALAHGGSLSINPDTGLVEASFLKRILPMVAGAALTGLSGGMINPATAGMLMGGFETLRTGDLGRGLMAGLGAYGGGGLGANLANIGGRALGESAARNLAEQAVAEGSTTAGMVEATQAPSGLAKMGAGLKEVTGSPQALGSFAKSNLMNIGAAAAPVLGDAMTQTAPMPGIPGPDEYDKQARVRLGSGFTGFVPQRPNPYYTPTGLGYAAGGEIQDYKFGGVLGKLLGEKRDGVHLPEDFESGYAEGGDIMLARGGDFDDQPGETAFMAAGGHLPRSSGADVGTYRDTDVDTASLGAYDAAKKRLEKIGKSSNVKMAQMPKTNVQRLGIVEMASGGLGGYSDGGRMLKGPGDGMSDDIPAVIGNKQPARLADGEFVVPADVVSHLGNGSTDAGARKLYKMMDKVRVARTGKKKQAPEVKTDKFLPK